MPSKKPNSRKHVADIDRDSLLSRLAGISFEKRVKALREVLDEATDGSPRSIEALTNVDALLFHRTYTTDADLKGLLKKADLPDAVEKGLLLYSTMQRLMAVCIPKCDRVGPSCTVTPLDRLTLQFLPPEEQLLEEETRPHFFGRKSPTLQSLAGCLLREKVPGGYSQRSVVRSIRAVQKHSFLDEDPRRELMIRSVDEFGSKKTEQTLSDNYQQMIAAAIQGININMNTLPVADHVAEQFAMIARSLRSLTVLAPVQLEIARAAAAMQIQTHDEIMRSVTQALAQARSANLFPLREQTALAIAALYQTQLGSPIGDQDQSSLRPLKLVPKKLK